MKKLLLLLILSFLSLNSIAKNGDVYYCVTKSYSSINLEGIYNYETNNFKFEFMKNKLIFDDKFPLFASRELSIIFGDDEYFHARSSDINAMPQFAIYSYGGEFVYSWGGVKFIQ